MCTNGQSRLAASKYRCAQKALLMLRGPGEWELELRDLLASDIRGPGAREFEIDEVGNEMDQDGHHRRGSKRKQTQMEVRAAEMNAGQDIAQTGMQVGEGMREVSWIWMDSEALNSVSSDASRHEGM